MDSLRTFLWKCYRFGKRHLFGGKGLTRYPLVKRAATAFERFLQGKHRDSVRKKGFVFHLDPRDSIREHEDQGDYEKCSTKLVEQLVRPGDTFVDIGASIGWYTLIASRLVGPMGRVYSFEPNPHSIKLLRTNVAENNCANVTIEHQAVSDKPQQVTLWIVDDIWTGSTLFDPRKDPAHFMDAGAQRPVQEYRLPATAVDRYLADKPVQFIKVDVEGSEGLVFRGMMETLRRNRDVVVLTECNPVALRGTGTDPVELLASIRREGFSVFRVDEEREVLVPLPGTPAIGTNLLFIRNAERVRPFIAHN